MLCYMLFTVLSVQQLMVMFVSLSNAAICDDRRLRTHFLCPCRLGFKKRLHHVDNGEESQDMDQTVLVAENGEDYRVVGQ